MNIDELRTLSAKRMEDKNRSSKFTENAFYLISGFITLFSCAYMGYYYYVYTYGEQTTIQVAAAGGQAEVTIPKLVADISHQAGVQFSKDIINVPDSFDAQDTFSKKYNNCRDEWKASQSKDKDMALMNFGDAMIRKQLGGRSKGLASIMICLTDGKTGYLCDENYRQKFSKLVTKFMDSSKTNNLGMSMTQSARKKRFDKLSEEEREDHLKSYELGKYDPGYIRLRKLFKAGYLRHSEFSGIFFSPPWLDSLSKGAGDHSRVCNA